MAEIRGIENRLKTVGTSSSTATKWNTPEVTLTNSRAQRCRRTQASIATRFEKNDANYLALVKLAASRIWMRFYESVS